ncbi:FeoA domain-containing protein [Streptomyces sp. NPDC047886]|uniref:FeoA domain-containing protein n=1 Tax=Streptomyces sp. NPDC047886 TaxID=3365490 RepID=UPI0037173820
MVLEECAAGARVTLRAVTARHDERLRMAELGFVPGAPIRVVGRGGGGRMVIALGDTRLGIDAPTGAALVVEPTW